MGTPVLPIASRSSSTSTARVLPPKTCARATPGTRSTTGRSVFSASARRSIPSVVVTRFISRLGVMEAL
jgi:hypothetical protein